MLVWPPEAQLVAAVEACLAAACLAHSLSVLPSSSRVSIFRKTRRGEARQDGMGWDGIGLDEMR